MDARRYCQVTAGSLLVVMLAVVLLSLTWIRQPQTGDLARIGGFTESSHGARSPATRRGFGKARFSRYGSAESAEADVLVLGDSFSYTGGRYNWVSHFVVRSGLDMAVGSVHRWQEILADIPDRPPLPPLVIVQVVERDAVDHFALAEFRLRNRPPPGDGPGPWQPLPLNRPESLPPPVRLPAKRFRNFEQRVSITVDVAWKSLRRLAGMPREEVLLFERNPARPAVFSSRSQDHIAVIRADLNGFRAAGSRYTSALEGLDTMRRLVTSLGSRMVVLVIPNRLSVYRSEMTDPPRRGVPAVVSRLAADAGLFDALAALRSGSERGIRDIYWPMDSHLSPVGSELLAAAFIRWLASHEILRP